mgnify:CR=1 FL=1
MNTKFLNGVWRVMLVLIFSLSLAGISTREAQALTYTVSNLNNSGAGSLRQAILDANANSPVTDSITFTVSGTITLGSSLPNITDHLTINGSGQNVTISGDDLYRVLYVNSGKTLTLNSVTIEHGNSATSGGAIFNYQGTLIVVDSAFSNNNATIYGGAIYVTNGSLNVTNTKFNSNSAGTSGGGIKTYNSTAAVLGSTFSGNDAGSGGGGIHNDNSSTLTLSNSTFSGNTSSWGGGIANTDSTLIVLSSTFSGNSTTTGGGGIRLISGSLILKNSILANTTGGTDCDADVAIGTNLHNLIENNSGCGTPVSSADPKLGPLASNGGLTKTFALLPNSPAIDAGDDANCTVAPVNGFDQRGETRTYGAHCDIGSYELKTGSLTTQSNGPSDGWILESSEDSSTGGTLDAAATTIRLGDDAADRQYRVILSFDTASLPDDAVITRVVLKLRYQGVIGTDPFTILGGLKVDIRKPYFGATVDLDINDFESTAGRSGAGTFKATPKNNWYFAVIGSAGYPYISLIDSTQFRLRFATGDNDDSGADYMRFFSGDYATASVRPTLVVEYYVP